MKKIIKLTFGIISAITIVALLLFIAILYPRFNNMKSEYATVGVVKEVSEYVRKNRKWPTNSDLSISENLTTIVYDIDILSVQKDVVISSIDTKNKNWYTYPRHKSDMNDLWNEIINIRLVKKSAQQGDAPETGSSE